MMDVVTYINNEIGLKFSSLGWPQENRGKPFRRRTGSFNKEALSLGDYIITPKNNTCPCCKFISEEAFYKKNKRPKYSPAAREILIRKPSEIGEYYSDHETKQRQRILFNLEKENSFNLRYLLDQYNSFNGNKLVLFEFGKLSYRQSEKAHTAFLSDEFYQAMKPLIVEKRLKIMALDNEANWLKCVAINIIKSDSAAFNKDESDKIVLIKN